MRLSSGNEDATIGTTKSPTDYEVKLIDVSTIGKNKLQANITATRALATINNTVTDALAGDNRGTAESSKLVALDATGLTLIDALEEKTIGIDATTVGSNKKKEAKLQAPNRVEQAITRLVKPTDMENLTVDKAARIGGISMVKGVGHSLEAVARSWSVVHRQNTSPNTRNAPVHTSQVNTSNDVNTSNAFSALVSEPVTDDPRKRVQHSERQATPKTSHSASPQSLK